MIDELINKMDEDANLRYAVAHGGGNIESFL